MWSPPSNFDRSKFVILINKITNFVNKICFWSIKGFVLTNFDHQNNKFWSVSEQNNKFCYFVIFVIFVILIDQKTYDHPFRLIKTNFVNKFWSIKITKTEFCFLFCYFVLFWRNKNIWSCYFDRSKITKQISFWFCYFCSWWWNKITNRQIVRYWWPASHQKMLVCDL